MFRNFYAEQNMADPRDSWYKPNLLYNIHYRPTTPPTPPKMIVVTREFNASVCTCGEHSCGPHYRIEREVVWSNKDVRKEEESGESKGKIQDDRDVNIKTESFDADSVKDDGDSDGDDDDDDDDDDPDGENDAKWKSDAACSEMGNGFKVARCEFTDSSSEKSQYHDNVNVSVTSIGEKLVEMKNDTTKLVQNSDDVIKGNILDSAPRFDGIAEPETPDIDVPDIEEPTVNLDGDNEECGSYFGIMMVYCDSEIHTSWNGNNKFHGH